MHLAQRNEPPPPPLIGRWDLIVERDGSLVPSWFEVERTGNRTLTGRFVGAFGSARPISEIRWSEGKFDFTIPVQFEQGSGEIRVEGEYTSGQLQGRITGPYFKVSTFKGTRAPGLIRSAEPSWGRSIALFDGKSMTGWHARHPKDKNGWVVRGGALFNEKPGNDLVTDALFTDFKLLAEFRCPKGSNSGLYLRGRYEVQIEDNFGQEPDSHKIGGVYGFLKPRINAGKRPEEWQTYELTLVGREVTLSLNGQQLIWRQEIPGITGGALDSAEGEPGPILIQGDHGPVEFRKLVLTPAK